MGCKTELAIGILNGAIGDYLERTNNGLATSMTWVHQGRPAALTREQLREIPARVTPRVVVLVHGLMNTEDAWTFPDGSDYGSLLARDLGYTPLTLRYNSGRAIPDNGESLARFLAALLVEYPVPLEELLLIGYSMGGLVVRSACHVARSENHAWLSHVARCVYIGTPHRGAPLERLGRMATRALRWVGDPYTRLAASVAELRSEGLRDLGNADLRHEDRTRRRLAVALDDPRHPVPLLPDIQHYLVAGAAFNHPGLASVLGDVMVPLASATDGVHTCGDGLAPTASRVRIFPGIGHVALARSMEVYEQVLSWCREEP